MINYLDTTDVTFYRKYHSIYYPDYSRYRVSYAVPGLCQPHCIANNTDNLNNFYLAANAAGEGEGGIGILSHFRNNSKPTVQVMNLRSGGLLDDLTWSSDNKRMVTLISNKAKIIDPNTFRFINEYTMNTTGFVKCNLNHPSIFYLIDGDLLEVLDIRQPNLRRLLQNNNNISFTTLMNHPNQNSFFCGDMNGNVYLYDIRGKNITTNNLPLIHTSQSDDSQNCAIKDIQFNEYHNHISILSNSLYIYDLNNLDFIMNNPYYQFDNSSQVVSIQYNVYNDLLYVHDLYNISVWDVENKRVKYNRLHTIEESIFTNEISPEILHMEINKLSCTEDLGMSYLVTSNVFSVEIFSNNFENDTIQVIDDIQEPDELELIVESDDNDSDPDDSWQNNPLSLPSNTCSSSLGSTTQLVYVCTTCNDQLREEISLVNNDEFENYVYGYICSECALNCHRGHSVVNIGTKHNVTCDCGNNLFKINNCNISLTIKPKYNYNNIYTHNNIVKYCYCNGNEELPMFQCVQCCDWFHRNCLFEYNELADIDGLFKCNYCLADESNHNMTIPTVDMICDICKQSIEEEEENIVRCEGRKQLNSLVQYICGKYIHKRCWENHMKIDSNTSDVIVLCLECEERYESFNNNNNNCNNIQQQPPPPSSPSFSSSSSSHFILSSSSSTMNINNNTQPPPPSPNNNNNTEDIINDEMEFREVAKKLYLSDKEAALEFVKSHLLGNLMNNLIEDGRSMVSKGDISKAFSDLMKKEHLPVKDVTVVKHHQSEEKKEDKGKKEKDDDDKKKE